MQFSGEHLMDNEWFGTFRKRIIRVMGSHKNKRHTIWRVFYFYYRFIFGYIGFYCAVSSSTVDVL